MPRVCTSEIVPPHDAGELQYAGKKTCGRLSNISASAVAGNFIKEFKLTRKSKDISDHEGTKHVMGVVLYIHKVSHNLKKVAVRHDGVVFSAPNKLVRLFPRITVAGETRRGCKRQHFFTFAYVKCTCAVVFEIPFSCRKGYIGQTVRLCECPVQTTWVDYREEGTDAFGWSCKLLRV